MVYVGKSLGESQHEVVTSDFEWTIIQFNKAFERYCLLIANAAGVGDLSFSELYLLIVVCLNETPQPVAQIARQMNEQALNTVHYGLGKLVASGLVKKMKDAGPSGGKSFVYTGTTQGRKLVKQYSAIRHDVLTEQTQQIDSIDATIRTVTNFIQMMASVYDEAGRVAMMQVRRENS